MDETESHSSQRRPRAKAAFGRSNATRSSEDTLLDRLEGAGYRSTEARRTLVDLIQMRNGAFRTADLLADARRRSLPLARASAFRTLELLEALGIIERLDFPEGNHAYVRCDPRRHHHHLVCSRCHRSLDIEGLGMSPVIRALERRTGYRISTHRIELFGLCPACQGEAAGTSAASDGQADCEPADPL